MSDARVVKASYFNIRPVPTRGQVQLILELPLEEMSSLIAKLGVPAMPGESKWVAVALLDELVASETEHQQKVKDLSRSLAGKERYSNLPADAKIVVKAAMLTKDPAFQEWSGCSGSPQDADNYIKRHCFISSKT